MLDADVVAVPDNLMDVLMGLRSVDSDSSRGMIFEVAPPAVEFTR